MDIALAVATLLGGVAGLWYFWDKIVWLWTHNREKRSGAAINLAANPTRQNIERVVLESDARGDWHRHVDEWRTVTSYQRDANLRFEVSYDDEGTQNADFQEPWANRHPDPHATGYWCRLYYGATLIESFILVSVDGGRTLLPVPESGADREHPGPVGKLNYRVAQIHDALGTLDEYMRRSGLLIAEV
jgi:hypothetical protein